MSISVKCIQTRCYTILVYDAILYLNKTESKRWLQDTLPYVDQTPKQSLFIALRAFIDKCSRSHYMHVWICRRTTGIVSKQFYLTSSLICIWKKYKFEITPIYSRGSLKNSLVSSFMLLYMTGLFQDTRTILQPSFICSVISIVS